MGLMKGTRKEYAHLSGKIVAHKQEKSRKMSIEIINAVWKHSQSTGRARVVLLAIADHQGQQGAWPSIETLAKMANSSKRSVSRDIAELAEMGELRVDERQAPMGGQYRSNLYWVLPQIMGYGSDMTDLSSDMTELDSDMTESAPDMTGSGTQTLNRTLNKKQGHANGATRLPNDFEPDPKSWDVMIEHFPWVDVKLETHKFRDYWASATRNALKKDWQAAWRNWVRRAAEYSKPKDMPQKKHKF